MSVAFNAVGDKIVTASDDHTARVWGLDGKQLAELQGHTGSVMSAAFNPAGDKIVTASFDRTARVWDLDGKQLAKLRGRPGLSSQQYLIQQEIE